MFSKFLIIVLFYVFPEFNSTFVVAKLFQYRIVGGVETKIENFPYQVRVNIRKGLFRYNICGGSIYKDDAIITAAHCFESNVKPSDVTVYAGASYVGGRIGETMGYTKNIMKHPNYNKIPGSNDIALLILTKPLPLNSRIQPIQLSELEEKELVGKKAKVSGWGATRENGTSAQMLRYTSLKIISNDECRKIYGEIIIDASICATSPPVLGSNRDSCQGDSGGPLTYDGKLVGVVAYGIGCGRNSIPGVYTRISTLREWIVKQYFIGKQNNR